MKNRQRRFTPLPELGTGGLEGVLWGPLSAQGEQRARTESSQTAPPAGFPPEAAGIACQISLMSKAPALIGALCFAVLSPAFIFNAGKGWVFILAFSPWLMAPHSERPPQC